MGNTQGTYDSEFASTGRAFLLWVRISANEHMIRNLFLTAGELDDSRAKAVAAQQQSLNSLAKVVLDNCVALDYLLAEQGGIYTIANTTSCT